MRMEIKELQDELEDIRPHEPEQSLAIIVAKVGQMAQGALTLGDENVTEQVDEATIDEIRRDLVAGTLVACVEYAAEHDLDLEEAIDERLDGMREAAEQQKAIQDALEEGDAAALAEALGAQAQEVPTGMFEDDEDDEDGPGRMFA